MKREHGIFITVLRYFYLSKNGASDLPFTPSHIDSRLVSFDIHLNVCKGKYLPMRNRLLAGKAGPTKILMIYILDIIYLGNGSDLKVTVGVT